MKKYKVFWICDIVDYFCGSAKTLEIVETNNPKEVLFNWACKTMVTDSILFNQRHLEHKDIRKNIIAKKGGSPERYWIDFSNPKKGIYFNVLSIKSIE